MKYLFPCDMLTLDIFMFSYTLNRRENYIYLEFNRLLTSQCHNQVLV